MSEVYNIDTTRKQQIVVEYLTPSGSAFAVNPQGDQVFMNQRLVKAMGVEAGDIYDAFIMPNYEDKRDTVPWRAMRVEPTKIDVNLSHVKDDADCNRIIRYMEGFEQPAHFTITELSGELNMPYGRCEDLCTIYRNIFHEEAVYSLRTNNN